MRFLMFLGLTNPHGLDLSDRKARSDQAKIALQGVVQMAHHGRLGTVGVTIGLKQFERVADRAHTEAGHLGQFGLGNERPEQDFPREQSFEDTLL